MQTVEHDELIRRKHFFDSQSARAIAQELGHARRAIAKAIRHAIPPGYRQAVPATCPVMAKFGSITRPGWGRTSKAHALTWRLSAK